MAPLTPSVYVSRLRRAFFLRVHPDRFRTQNATIRRQQAKLVQALNDRMSWPDFIRYNFDGGASSILSAAAGRHQYQRLSYVMEHRDGTLFQQSIQLNDSVQKILESMANALRESGAASLPPPPQPVPNKSMSKERNGDGILWAPPPSSSQQSTSTASSPIDHQFDVNTTKGRDLLAFCKSLDPHQVQQRRAFRMDANSAAMMVRQLYQFQSIDGTGLHWSSESFARLCKALISLYEEHHDGKFNVTSFYPLRLVFSNDDDQDSLDLFGGSLRLHPGYTPVQWLDKLQQVTLDRLELLQQHRQQIESPSRIIQSLLGVKIRKGFSCSSRDYFEFVTYLANSLRPPDDNDNNTSGITTTTKSLALESVFLTVESAQSVRFRGHVTPEGHVRVGAGMTVDAVLRFLSRHGEEARQRRIVDQHESARSNDQARRVQYELGLSRKVYKAGTFRISHQQFQDCLTRISTLNEEQKNVLKVSISGNALGVVGSGQFCHLGDDGSIVIPHDWQLQASEAKVYYF